MSFIEEFIISTHKSVENRPEPYGLFHIVFVISSILLMLGICYLARKNKEKTFRAVMLSLGVILLLSEVYKQLYYYFAAGSKGYDWYIFPFQLCSVPVYLAIIIGLLKKCPLRDALCEYMVSIGFLGGIIAYAEPSGILNGLYFTLIHSCLWHALLIFFALYILFTDNACRKPKNYISAVFVLGGVVLTATVLNVSLHNKPNFNMCYVSPYYNTPLAVFDSFDKFFQGAFGSFGGRIVSIIVYLIALVLGGFIIYSLSYLIKSKLTKKEIEVKQN